MLNILHDFKFQMIRGKNVWIQTFKKFSEATESRIENNIYPEWVQQNKADILKVVNSSSLTDIKKYIEVSKAKLIVSNREANGLYSSLDDFLLRNEIESNVLTQFYTSIIDHKVQKKRWNKYKIVPDLEEIPVPETVLAVHIGANAITWTFINCNSKILDWDAYIWYDESSRITTYQLMNLATSIAKILPVSDSYVIEDLSFRQKEVNHSSYRRQLAIAIMSCIKFKETAGLSNNVYVLRPQTSARMFDLLVGNEVIATAKTVNNILNCNDAVEEFEDKRTNKEIKSTYTRQRDEVKEQMGWSLLTALTFNRLLSIWNPDMSYKSNSEI